MIKAILFDLDGVLMNAKEWHYDALNEALGLFGYRIDQFEHKETYDGLPTRRKLEILTREKGLSTELHDFIHEMKQIYTHKMIVNLCRPVFQHEYALSRLKDDGYLLGVCTNSIRLTLDRSLELMAIKQFIDVSLSWEDVTIPKPDPAIYKLAFKTLDVDPQEALVLEDGVYGIEAAIASKAHLMKIKSIYDVNYANIINQIQKIV